jgi:hypothetical protein
MPSFRFSATEAATGARFSIAAEATTLSVVVKSALSNVPADGSNWLNGTVSVQSSGVTGMVCS